MNCNICTNFTELYLSSEIYLVLTTFTQVINFKLYTHLHIFIGNTFLHSHPDNVISKVNFVLKV